MSGFAMGDDSVSTWLVVEGLLDRFCNFRIRIFSNVPHSLFHLIGNLLSLPTSHNRYLASE